MEDERGPGPGAASSSSGAASSSGASGASGASSAPVDASLSTQPAPQPLGLPHDAVENAQQFFAWFASVEASMERGRADIYRSGSARPHAPAPAHL